MLNNIIRSVHMKSIMPLDEMDDRNKYKKYENFLNSLPERFNLQPKQEWSEEDERIRKFLVKYFEFYQSHPALTLDVNIWQGEKVSNILAYFERLKSLRPQPHWKPSEEQIQALTVAIDEAARCEEPYWRDSLHDVLLSLHTDLKKLM